MMDVCVMYRIPFVPVVTDTAECMWRRSMLAALPAGALDAQRGFGPLRAETVDRFGDGAPSALK